MDWAPSQDAEPSDGLQDSRSFEMVPDAEEDDASLLTVSSFSLPGGTAAGDSPEAGSPPGPGPLAELFNCPDCGQEPTNGWCPLCHLAKGIGMGRIETAWGLYLFTGCILTSLFVSARTKRAMA